MLYISGLVKRKDRINLRHDHAASTFWNFRVFSCPEQLKRWPCHWLTDWLTFDFCVYNDYKDYSDYNNYNDYRDRDLDLNLDLGRFNDTVQCAGRPFETKYMSQYIDSGQKNRFDVRIQNLFQKLKIPSGKTGFMAVFCFFSGFFSCCLAIFHQSPWNFGFRAKIDFFRPPYFIKKVNFDQPFPH